MAQETAGTIGIPVLKNEVMPYLTDYAKRRERAELYKQKAEQRAAELAAKKAAEEAKYVPKFESSSGGIFGHITKANADKRINDALTIYRDPSTPQQTKMLTAYEANRLNMDDADLDKQLETKILKTADDLKNAYRKVGTDYAYKWGKQQQQYRTPEEFAAEVRSNPDLIDFDAIGKKAKEYKQTKYSVEIPGSNITKQVDMSPLFDYKWEKDPFTGGQVPVVTGVNGVEAQKLIKSDPDINDAFDVFVKNNANKYQDQDFIDPNTGSYIKLRREVAEQKAAEDFMNNAFGKYGKIEYGKSFQMPRKGGAGGGGSSDQFTMSVATPAGQATHEFDIESLGYGLNKITKQKQLNTIPQKQFGDVGGKDDTTFVYEKEYVHPANKKVRLLQTYEKGKLEDYIEQTPDGQFLLKSGFNYSNPTKRTLYFADEDLYFGGDEKGPYIKNGVRQNWTRIRKGKEIPTATAESLIAQAEKAGKKSGVTKETGYEVTANMYTGEEGDVAKRPSVKMFIPEANAGEIKKHIEMEQQKKRRKRGPETFVEGYQGSEVDLGY